MSCASLTRKNKKRLHRSYQTHTSESSFLLVNDFNTKYLTPNIGRLIHVLNAAINSFKLALEWKLETKNWRHFSRENQLDLEVKMYKKETYLVRFPCRDSIWFKLFLYGDGHQNSHIELYSKNSGNIYCKMAGSEDWFEGEKTDFQINRSWECEEDEENVILE